MDTDLIQINENKGIAICILESFDHYVYHLKKKEKEQKKNQKKEMKEIHFTLYTDDHDLEHKATQVNEFLKKKIEVKVLISLKGREINRTNVAKDMITRFISMCETTCSPSVKVEEKCVFAIIKS